MNTIKRRICEAVVLACSFGAASMASAQATNALGGGSSTVAPIVASEIALGALAITYVSASDSAGQAAFLTDNASQLGTTGTVHFANSDAALTSLQVDTAGTYVLTPTDGRLIQLPFIVMPVAIPYVSQPSSVSGTAALDDNALCGIFSGKLTNWNQIVNPATGALYTTINTPITVVYRTDGTATTDQLTRHLSVVCTTGAGGNSNVAFTETRTFASNFGGFTLPANFVGESGSSGVAAELLTLRAAGTAGFGYLIPDYTNTTLAPASSFAATNQLTVASLRNRHSNIDMAPTYLNAAAAVSLIPPPMGAQEANPFSWVPGSVPGSASWTLIADPTIGYPISGTSNVIVSQCYKTPVMRSRMVSFLNRHYNDPTILALIHSHGLDVPSSSYRTPINNDILTNANARNLNIANATVCPAGFGR